MTSRLVHRKCKRLSANTGTTTHCGLDNVPLLKWWTPKMVGQLWLGAYSERLLNDKSQH
jgi:hypothetical protein